MAKGNLLLGVQRVALKRWSEFIDKCLLTRLDADKFESWLPYFRSKYPLPPDAIADLLLRPRRDNHDCLDPRMPLYLQAAVKLGYVNAPAMLKALYRYSTSHAQVRLNNSNSNGNSNSNSNSNSNDETANGEKLVRWRSSYGTEEVIFYRLTKAVAQGEAIQSAGDAIQVVEIMAKWMSLFTAAFAAFAEDVMGQLNNAGPRDEMESARAAFVALLLGVCENQLLVKTMGKPMAKRARKAISESLINFVPTLQNASIADRLEMFRSTIAEFDPVEKSKDAAASGIEDILDSAVALENFMVPEMHIRNTRAGLYIYLNACLVGRPLLDDMTLLTYLHNRYQGDIQTTAIDLILASFDVLANAVFRNEGQKAAHLLRSYLINKLPLLLVGLGTSMFPPTTPEFCITEALGQVDTNTFPTLSSMFDDSRNSNPFTDNVREEFCFACSLHNLMPQSHIETLLGENTYQTLPSGGRYAKNDLVTECLGDAEKIQSLIGELDNMDGNVGAVCEALTEVIRQLCLNKETMSLKMLCTQLARKPLALDVMLLFEKPLTILHPICELLDNWGYEEDQGEYRPVYEEFGSILLLLLAFAYRYSLSAADLGIRSHDSFVSKLLSRGHLSRPLDELTEQEKGHLDGWIRGLFASDTGGLGDELMSSCPPQEFYLLIPSLFQNIALALSSGYLSDETLKSGFEYLIDAFLMPCLVTAIRFLSDYLCTDQASEQKAIVKMLQLILAPHTITNEASMILSSVLNMVAKPLEHALRTYQRRDPKNLQIEPLLRALKESIPLSRRTGGAENNELESWTGGPHGPGLTSVLKHTMQGFVQWSLHPGVNTMPTSYSHRQVLVGLKIFGAKRMLGLILDEVKSQSEAGSASEVFDIATALICAPDVTNLPQPPAMHSLDAGAVPPPLQKRLTLRDALKSEAENCKKMHKSDPAMAEAVVRLYRKVEAQMAPNQDEILQAEIAAAAAGALDDSIQAAAAAAAAGGAQGDAMAVDGVRNMDIMGMGTDLMGGSSAGGAGSLSLDDDIFGGLDTGADPFDGWDTMDLS